MNRERVQEFCDKMGQLIKEINEFNESGNTCEFRASHLDNRLQLIKIEMYKVSREEGIPISPESLIGNVPKLRLM